MADDAEVVCRKWWKFSGGVLRAEGAVGTAALIEGLTCGQFLAERAIDATDCATRWRVPTLLVWGGVYPSEKTLRINVDRQPQIRRQLHLPHPFRKCRL